MTPDQVFLIATYGVMPAWALLILAPNWEWTQRLVHAVLAPLILGLLYTWYAFTGAFFGPDVPDGGGFGTLAGVMTMFTSPTAVLAGWVHYLVFDLFVGAWEARDSRRRGFSHWMLIPCLLLTLLLGPVGLLLYVVLRYATGKGGWTLDEREAAS